MGKPAVAIELSSAERRELKSLARRRKTAQGFLSREIRDSLGDDDDGFYLYRHMLHPNLPNLVFVGRASTFLSIVTYTVQARWLAEAIAGRVTLPGRDAMLEAIALMKRWKRSWMPFSPARSARLLLHMANYHDELLRIFGANPFRKRGIFAPLKELVAPYQSGDYRQIASGGGLWRAPPQSARSRLGQRGLGR